MCSCGKVKAQESFWSIAPPCVPGGLDEQRTLHGSHPPLPWSHELGPVVNESVRRAACDGTAHAIAIINHGRCPSEQKLGPSHPHSHLYKERRVRESCQHPSQLSCFSRSLSARPHGVRRVLVGSTAHQQLRRSSTFRWRSCHGH